MKKALIIFTRNPELGKCKTRLAKSIGDKAALDIYKYLLQHTAKVAKSVDAHRFVFYSKTIAKNDIWSANYFIKHLQKGTNLGMRMQNAFQEVFNQGFKNVIIIGSDLLDLDAALIDTAFEKLTTNDVVIGPAKDGGYYLLGLKSMHSEVFKNKKWGTKTVRQDTINDLKDNTLHLLEELNDIDTFEDMNHYNELKPFYNANA